MIFSLFILTIFPLYVFARPSGCHAKKDAIGEACSFVTDQDYRYWCSQNAGRSATAKDEVYVPSQGNTARLKMTENKGRNIAMSGSVSLFAVA